MATILVIEDTQTDAARVRTALEPYRWELKFVTTGADARAAIEEEIPVAIVMDIILPDDTGFQLCRDIKTDPKTEHIPIVMCSSKSTDIDQFWAMKQGAVLLLPKPLNPKLLSQHIRQLVPEPPELPVQVVPEPPEPAQVLPEPVVEAPTPASELEEKHIYAQWQFLAQ